MRVKNIVLFVSLKMMILKFTYASTLHLVLKQISQFVISLEVSLTCSILVFFGTPQNSFPSQLVHRLNIVELLTRIFF